MHSVGLGYFIFWLLCSEWKEKRKYFLHANDSARSLSPLWSWPDTFFSGDQLLGQHIIKTGIIMFVADALHGCSPLRIGMFTDRQNFWLPLSVFFWKKKLFVLKILELHCVMFTIIFYGGFSERYLWMARPSPPPSPPPLNWEYLGHCFRNWL